MYAVFLQGIQRIKEMMNTTVVYIAMQSGYSCQMVALA